MGARNRRRFPRFRQLRSHQKGSRGRKTVVEAKGSLSERATNPGGNWNRPGIGVDQVEARDHNLAQWAEYPQHGQPIAKKFKEGEGAERKVKEQRREIAT